jgi:hypothetical protein
MPAMACQKVDAAQLQSVLSEMGAQWSERDGRVMLQWGWEWDGAGPAQRLALLRAFADGDTCLAGQAREISFYRKGMLVGTASPTSGIHLVGETRTVHAGVRPAEPAKDLDGCPN